MTRDQANTYLAAIITTLEETGEGKTGIMYAALKAHGLTLDDFLLLQGVMVSGKLATLSNNTLTLTAAGHDMAARINGAVEAVA